MKLVFVDSGGWNVSFSFRARGGVLLWNGRRNHHGGRSDVKESSWEERTDQRISIRACVTSERSDEDCSSIEGGCVEQFEVGSRFAPIVPRQGSPPAPK